MNEKYKMPLIILMAAVFLCCAIAVANHVYHKTHPMGFSTTVTNQKDSSNGTFTMYLFKGSSNNNLNATFQNNNFNSLMVLTIKYYIKSLEFKVKTDSCLISYYQLHDNNSLKLANKFVDSVKKYNNLLLNLK